MAIPSLKLELPDVDAVIEAWLKAGGYYAALHHGGGVMRDLSTL